MLTEAERDRQRSLAGWVAARMPERKPSRQTHMAVVVSPNMGGDEDGFRGLYDDLLAANGTQQRSRVLEHAQEWGRRQLDALAALREREPAPTRRNPDDEQAARLWECS